MSKHKNTTFVPLKIFINNLNRECMNHYEAVFILTPVLSDVQMKEAVEKFKSLLEQEGG